MKNYLEQIANDLPGLQEMQSTLLLTRTEKQISLDPTKDKLEIEMHYLLASMELLDNLKSKQDVIDDIHSQIYLKQMLGVSDKAICRDLIWH